MFQNSASRRIAASPAQTPDPNNLTLPNGYQARVVTDRLNLPDAVTLDPDGAIYIAQLNGGENEGKGQVVKLIGPNSTPVLILDKLFKPTGITFAGGNLYIVAGNTVQVSRVHDGTLDQPSVLYKDLPFNGRSEGQIYTMTDATSKNMYVYFQSTGTEAETRNSGFIYRMNADGTDRQVYARGFKNAYAMAWDRSGKMYATEIGDGYIDNGETFPEEINLIQQGHDYGWIGCYGDKKVNHSAGGTDDQCAKTEGALATFAPHATPTGLAVLNGKLIVALWNGNPPRLVSVDPTTGAVSEFASGFQRPISLLTLPDNDLLVLDQDANTLWRLSKR